MDVRTQGCRMIRSIVKLCIRASDHRRRKCLSCTRYIIPALFSFRVAVPRKFQKNQQCCWSNITFFRKRFLWSSDHTCDAFIYSILWTYSLYIYLVLNLFFLCLGCSRDKRKMDALNALYRPQQCWNFGGNNTKSLSIIMIANEPKRKIEKKAEMVMIKREEREKQEYNAWEKWRNRRTKDTENRIDERKSERWKEETMIDLSHFFSAPPVLVFYPRVIWFWMEQI